MGVSDLITLPGNPQLFSGNIFNYKHVSLINLAILFEHQSHRKNLAKPEYHTAIKNLNYYI